MKKLAYIDGLKGIGAFIVYLCHFVYAFYYGAYSLQPEHVQTASGIELDLGKTPLNLFYNGNFAVCLFLVLSGFVICLGYFRTRDKKRLKEGAVKRYFRLMPVIAAVNLLIFLLMSLGLYCNKEAAVLTKSPWFAGFNQFEPSLPAVIYESFIGCFLRGSNDYNGVLWTIPYLFFGALVIYLAAWLVGENRLRYIAYGVMLLVSARTDIYFAAIFLGFVLCDFACTQEYWMERYRRQKAVPALIFLLGLYLSSYPSIGMAMEGTIYGVLPPAYAVTYHVAGAFLMAAGILGLDLLQKIFAWKPFLFLGKISYSLYLLHFPVIATFGCWFFLTVRESLGYHRAVLLDFLLTTLLVLGISMASARYLEPAGRKLEIWAAAFAGKEKKRRS